MKNHSNILKTHIICNWLHKYHEMSTAYSRGQRGARDLCTGKS
jgi:hypothetical protein